jgi:hypothetical protein
MSRVTIRVLVLVAVIQLPQVLLVRTGEVLAIRTLGYSATHAITAFPVPVAISGPQASSSTYRDLADSLGIVVNRSNPVENLSFVELRKIFLGEQSHWSNGRRISLVMLEPGKQERQAVLAQVCRMDDKDFDKHYSQGLSSGEIHAAPKTLATSAEVLKYVYNVPGAIGYLRVTEADDSVKILHIESRMPGDKDYGIRLHQKAGKS